MSYDKEIDTQIVEAWINNSENKLELAKSMIRPIRRNLDYQGLARRTFIITQMPIYYYICY